MVDLEKLRARSMRAYEAGRLRAASRIGLYIAPIIALCWLMAEDREACACLALLLLVAAVVLRWRDRRGSADVAIGLIAGSVPLVMGLLLTVLRPVCGGPVCLTISAMSGAVAGLCVAILERQHPSRVASSFAALAVTMLAASLGCVSLGLWGIAGVMLGVAVGHGLFTLTTQR